MRRNVSAHALAGVSFFFVIVFLVTSTASCAPAPTGTGQVSPSSTVTAGAIPVTETPVHSPGQSPEATRRSVATSTATNISSTATSTNLTSTPTSTPTVPSIAVTSTPTPNHSPAATAVATGSGNALVFTPGADAYVAEASPTTNFGATATLESGGGSGSTQTSFIRFNVIGTHDTIQDVKLRVFCTRDTANGPAVYLADNGWTESGASGITWNNQPALLSSEIDNKDALAAGTWVEYDVSSLVIGDGTYTFALVADGTDDTTFSSREGSTPPQLVVTFAP